MRVNGGLRGLLKKPVVSTARYQVCPFAAEVAEWEPFKTLDSGNFSPVECRTSRSSG